MTEPRVEVSTDESGEFTFSTVTYPGWVELPKPKRWRQVAWLAILCAALAGELWIIGRLLW